MRNSIGREENSSSTSPERSGMLRRPGGVTEPGPASTPLGVAIGTNGRGVPPEASGRTRRTVVAGRKRTGIDLPEPILSRGSWSPEMEPRIPFRVTPMPAFLVAKPFDRPGWVYEEKYDGERMLAYKEGSRVRLVSRSGKDETPRFPTITAAIEALAPVTLLLDGEVVVFDPQGVSRFQLLQQSRGEVKYAVFDCLFLDGQDLRRAPLSSRRAALERVVPSNHVLVLSHRLAPNGLTAFQVAKDRGYEGLVAKDLSSPYEDHGPSPWLKVKVHQEDEFVIVGYTAPKGSRTYFGALLLGAHDHGELHYVGKVGTGFDERTRETLYGQFRRLVTPETVLVDPPRERGVTFLRPRLVAQISYREMTAARKLRQPVYLGLRDDKKAEDVVVPVPRALPARGGESRK